jgi:hypothetical protein
VSLFRRREPLHVRLARQGGFDIDGTPNEPTRPAWDAAGIHGNHRVREWDAVITADAPDLSGEKAAFVTLPNGDAVVIDGPTEIAPLATALERELDPPYRAEAVKRNDGLWAVAGRRIEIIELPGVEGEEIELSAHGADRTLLVDGERGFGSIPQLERPEHVVRARRVDGELWEVETAPL